MKATGRTSQRVIWMAGDSVGPGGSALTCVQGDRPGGSGSVVAPDEFSHQVVIRSLAMFQTLPAWQQAASG
jgi:hypothetical protein